MGRAQAGRVTVQQLHFQHAHMQRLDAQQIVGKFQVSAGPLEGAGIALVVAPIKDPLLGQAGLSRFLGLQRGDDDGRIVVHRDEK